LIKLGIPQASVPGSSCNGDILNWLFHNLSYGSLTDGLAGFRHYMNIHVEADVGAVRLECM